MIKFSDLEIQNKFIYKKLIEDLKKIIKSTRFIKGKFVEKFEDEFSKKINVKYCLGVANGTDALEIAIESLNLPKGSEIIIPANSFIATAEAAYRQGLKIIFCDCNDSDYTLDVDKIEQLINKNTKAIVAVHLYGHPCHMNKLLSLKRKYKLKIIEDCAQSHFSKHDNQFTGTLGDIGCFSFFPGKILGAYGDAGCITTNNKKLYKKAKMIANHGGLKKYHHEIIGRNSRMDELQAVVLLNKLKFIDKWIKKRLDLADYYSKLFQNSLVTVVKNKANCHNTYCYYVIRSSKIKSIKEELKKNNIEFIIHYPNSIPNLKAFKDHKQFNYNKFAWTYGNKVLSLPLGIHLNKYDVKKIVDIIKSA